MTHKAAVPQSEWKWYGESAHLIVGFDCRFHLATEIGDYIVSTVGKYWPDRVVRKIMADSRGIEIVGQGDQWDADYRRKMPNNGYEDIGLDRFYETMVFRVTGAKCSCGCGIPEIISSELDFRGYNNPVEATAGHMELCNLWASAEKQSQIAESLL